MDKPRIARSVRRKNIEGIEFFGRVTIPAILIFIVVALLALTVIVSFSYAMAGGPTWMFLPTILILGGAILFGIIRGIIELVRQFRVLNEKDLSNGEA